MQDSGYQHFAVVSIVDDVVFDCERSDARAKLRPEPTHPRLLGQQFESLDDGVHESISGCGAGVLGDKGPDLGEILLGESG